MAGTPGPAVESCLGVDRLTLTWRYLPQCMTASLVTLVLSFLSMALAIAVGVALAIGRVYGRPWLRVLVTTYVEVIRGTPVLLQLFIIYYGFAEIVRLPAFLA